MKYNVAQTVVDIIEADDPDSAFGELNRRLMSEYTNREDS